MGPYYLMAVRKIERGGGGGGVLLSILVVLLYHVSIVDFDSGVFVDQFLCRLLMQRVYAG